MRNALTLSAAMALAIAATPAFAQEVEINYAEGSLGYSAIMADDYATAEDQLRHSEDASSNDPARLINLGHVMAQTGRTDEAMSLFQKASRAKRVELILSDGRVVDSREAAMAALANLKHDAALRTSGK